MSKRGSVSGRAALSRIACWMAACMLLGGAAPTAATAQGALPAEAGWQVAIDPLDEPLDFMNQQARRAGAPLFMTGRGFDITREEGADQDYAERQALINEWAYTLTERLERFGFRTTSRARFRALFGMSMEDFRDRMIAAQPYGTRDATERHLGEFFVLINWRPDECPGTDDAYAAMVMTYYPVEGVGSDFGSVAMFLLGAGECASGRAARRQLADLTTQMSAEFSGRRR